LDACVQQRGAGFIEVFAMAIQQAELSLARRPISELLSSLRIEEFSVLPKAILGLTSHTLLEAYPSQSLIALELLSKLSITIKSCPKDLLIDLLFTLSEGLCICLEDKKEVFEDHVYNSSVRTT
jgi:hypothetical protein